jgi:hypothetical protein
MSAQVEVKPQPVQRTTENKPVERVNVPRDAEIEKIKRQLHHLIDRVDALKSK